MFKKLLILACLLNFGLGQPGDTENDQMLLLTNNLPRSPVPTATFQQEGQQVSRVTIQVPYFNDPNTKYLYLLDFLSDTPTDTFPVTAPQCSQYDPTYPLYESELYIGWFYLWNKPNDNNSTAVDTDPLVINSQYSLINTNLPYNMWSNYYSEGGIVPWIRYPISEPIDGFIYYMDLSLSQVIHCTDSNSLTLFETSDFIYYNVSAYVRLYQPMNGYLVDVYPTDSSGNTKGQVQNVQTYRFPFSIAIKKHQVIMNTDTTFQFQYVLSNIQAAVLLPPGCLNNCYWSIKLVTLSPSTYDGQGNFISNTFLQMISYDDGSNQYIPISGTEYGTLTGNLPPCISINSQGFCMQEWDFNTTYVNGESVIDYAITFGAEYLDSDNVTQYINTVITIPLQISLYGVNTTEINYLNPFNPTLTFYTDATFSTSLTIFSINGQGNAIYGDLNLHLSQFDISPYQYTVVIDNIYLCYPQDFSFVPTVANGGCNNSEIYGSYLVNSRDYLYTTYRTSYPSDLKFSFMTDFLYNDLTLQAFARQHYEKNIPMYLEVDYTITTTTSQSSGGGSYHGASQKMVSQFVTQGNTQTQTVVTTSSFQLFNMTIDITVTNTNHNNIIIGSSVGGFVFLCLLCLLFFWCKRRSDNHQEVYVTKKSVDVELGKKNLDSVIGVR